MARRNLNEDERTLYDILDRAQYAITNAHLIDELDWSEERLKLAKKALLRANSIYITQEGVILQQYATLEQQVWHLGWSIGLVEVAGMHLTLDRELLLEAPRAFRTLRERGSYNSAEKLMEFRQRVTGAMEIPRQLLNVQQEILHIIDEEIEREKAIKRLQKKFPPH